MLKIEGIGVPIDWKKSVWIKLDRVKARRLTHVGGHRADDKAHSNRFFVKNIGDDLELLLVHMAEELPSNNVLISVDDSVVSPAVGSETLIEVWNMSNDDGGTINLFKSRELVLKPCKHVSRIMESDEIVIVCDIANIGVQRDNLGVLIVP